MAKQLSAESTKIKQLSPKTPSKKELKAQAEAKKLEEALDAMAKVCLNMAGDKYKMLVIIQDSKGRGITRATQGFTPIEFVQWVNAIIRFNTTNL